MASELRVNTLKDASGNNSVAMEYVSGGSAKAWVRFNASSGTPTANDSLNFSSFTDHAVGNHTISFSSSFDNANYAFLIGASVAGTDARVAYNTNDAPATGSFRIGTVNSSFSVTDATHSSVGFMGDLT
jgi:hypothetical protein